jgi:hypothetical protein
MILEIMILPLNYTSEVVGLEPTLIILKTIVLPIKLYPLYIIFLDPARFELASSACKADVFPEG